MWLISFAVFLIRGLIMLMSSNSFFSLIGLEIISIRVLRFLLKCSTPRVVVNYRIIQIFSSARLLLRFFLGSTILSMCFILIKIGIFPNYTWFFELFSWSGFVDIIIISFPSKVPSIIFFFYLYTNRFFDKVFLILILFSLVIIVFLRALAADKRLFLAASSINSLRWMLVGILVSTSVWCFFFFLPYFFLILGLIFRMYTFFSQKIIRFKNFRFFKIILLFLSRLPLGNIFFFKFYVLIWWGNVVLIWCMYVTSLVWAVFFLRFLWFSEELIPVFNGLNKLFFVLIALFIRLMLIF